MLIACIKLKIGTGKISWYVWKPNQQSHFRLNNRFLFVPIFLWVLINTMGLLYSKWVPIFMGCLFSMGAYYPNFRVYWFSWMYISHWCMLHQLLYTLTTIRTDCTWLHLRLLGMMCQNKVNMQWISLKALLDTYCSWLLGYIPCWRLCINLAHCNFSSISLYQVVDSFQVSLSHLWKVCVHMSSTTNCIFKTINWSQHV